MGIHTAAIATLRRLVSRGLGTGLSIGLAFAVAVGTPQGSDRIPSAGPTPLPTAKGVWPLAPRPPVVHGFDPPSVKWGSGHRGVDLGGRAGQPVRSAVAGTVLFAGRLAGKGVVSIDIGGGRRTTYEPVRARVQVGQQVKRGQVIGTLLMAPSHCLPRSCLHWGLLRGERYLDPLTLIGMLPVRLYPVG